MNTAGSVRSREWASLLRDVGLAFSKLALIIVLVFLLSGFIFHLYFTPSKIEAKPRAEVLASAKKYSELLTMTENLYGLKESIKTYKNRLTAIAVANRNRPEFLWSKKEISGRDKFKERYETLMADYGTMVFEYNSRHEAINYCFIYPSKLPSGVVKTLPKYYVSLE
ncbi:MAG: hypothetical protein AAB394_03870 [Patescibacteria group bacterium]